MLCGLCFDSPLFFFFSPSLHSSLDLASSTSSVLTFDPGQLETVKKLLITSWPVDVETSTLLLLCIYACVHLCYGLNLRDLWLVATLESNRQLPDEAYPYFVCLSECVCVCVCVCVLLYSCLCEDILACPHFLTHLYWIVLGLRIGFRYRIRFGFGFGLGI